MTIVVILLALQSLNFIGVATNYSVNLVTPHPELVDPFLFESIGQSEDAMSLEHATLLHFTVDFAVWADWDSVVLFFANASGLPNMTSKICTLESSNMYIMQL